MQERVNQFLGFFDKKCSSVQSLSVSTDDAVFKKMLYVGILDTLSKTTAYPTIGNRERLTSFVKHFCSWKYCEKMSLPHLVRFLEKTPHPDFTNLREFVLPLFDQWKMSESKFDVEPDFSQLKHLWPRNIQKHFADVYLESMQHLNLFYRYRNSLIHELRELGYGIESEKDIEPFYQYVEHSSKSKHSWELVYPLRFYESLCQTAIKNLAIYYVKNRIDPYSFFQFGSYWIEELNV